MGTDLIMGSFCSLDINKLGPAGGKAIAKALETNKAIQTIRYAHTCLVSTSL